MKSGHQIVMSDSAPDILIQHSAGSKIEFDAGGKITITALSTVDVNATVLNVHAPIANFDSIINCQTLIAGTAVVSPSYTPGAGNVW